MAVVQEEKPPKLVHHVGEANYPMWLTEDKVVFRVDLDKMKPHCFYYIDHAEECVAIRESESVVAFFDSTKRGLKMHLSRMQK